MDFLRYQYIYNSHGLANNRLDHITDTVPENNYSIDLDNQQQNNYLYDMNGNLLHDEANSIDSIKWNAYGKVSRVVSSEPKRYNIDLMYDAMGNRIVKKLTSTDDPGDLTKMLYEFYLRDAQGNIMGIYTSKYNSELERWELYLTEHHLYGSSRLGIHGSDTLAGFNTYNLVDHPQLLYNVQEYLNNLTYNLQVQIARTCTSDPDSKKILYCDIANTFCKIEEWCTLSGFSYEYHNNDLWVLNDSHTGVSVMEAIQIL